MNISSRANTEALTISPIAEEADGNSGRRWTGEHALACPTCNLAKGSRLTGRDPLSGAVEPLFHPRKHAWAEHFCLAGNQLAIRGLTPTGRATVARLQLNSRIRLVARLDWHAAEKWP